MASWGNQPKYGDFEIVGANENKPRLLGKGGFGKTFEATRTEIVVGETIVQQVAVKVLKPDSLASESNRFQLIQELKTLAQLKHPNLIQYVACGEQNGEVYYAMELCRGGDLVGLVRKLGPLPERIVARLALQVAAGLHVVHQRYRLIHRDIKPANIMIADALDSDLDARNLEMLLQHEESLLRIVDFGLVNCVRPDDEGPLKFAGSPMYASPEQILERPMDGRSDIYSLGMTCWYLLQGRGPLLDPSGEELRDPRAAMRRHTDGEEHEKNLPKHLSPEFRAVLARMVLKSPERRYKTAFDLQAALRDYLSSPLSVQIPAQFVPMQLPGPLDSVFEIETNLRAHPGHSSYVAREKASFRKVKLNLVADLQKSDPGEVDARTKQLCHLAEISRQPAFPSALLPVYDVLKPSDFLACTEEAASAQTLADILKRRRQPIKFNEAVAVLRPIAEGLDFMLNHGQDSVYLEGDDIHITGMGSDPQALTKPLTEWENLQVQFSMMCLPLPSDDAAGGAFNLDATMPPSVLGIDRNLHPVPSFSRLLYRVVSGSEVAQAAEISPAAYGNTVNLSASSNIIIRDVLCGQRQYASVLGLLKEFCGNEGIKWSDASTASISASRTRDITRTAAPTATAPSLSDSRRGRTSSASSVPSGRSPISSIAASGSSPAAPSAKSSIPASFDSIGQTVPANSLRAEPAGTVDNGAGMTMRASGAEKLCEVVSPGVVRSPYDPDEKEMEVPAQQWVADGRVKCPVTGKLFRLPRRLDPLVAKIVSPGVIQSPYASAPQRVKWTDWNPGARIICDETSKPLTLPMDLPAPEAIIFEAEPGVVVSPYSPQESRARIPVDPAHWEPGFELICPITQLLFHLPGVLPPLQAQVDVSRPGILVSPYGPSPIHLEPTGWVAGQTTNCPDTRKLLLIPKTVEQWTAQASLLDAARKTVSNPYQPGASVVVSGAEWVAGGRITCAGPAGAPRALILPAELPALVGEQIDERTGVIRSPYSGEEMRIKLKDWAPNAEVVCSKTGRAFRLPPTLLDWVPVGEIGGLAPGRVKSPFEPHPEIEVAPAEWRANQVLTCPATQRKFALPATLPLLAGAVEQGKPGWVFSPFGTQWQSVPLDEWTPGRRLECTESSQPFALPAKLEEWIVDGEWIPGSPGKIRSPFQSRVVMDVPPAQWKAGGLATCPETKRHFRIPAADNFPTIELERETYEYGLNNPDATEETAARALAQRHRGATAAMVRGVWMRHEIETSEKRSAQIEVAKIVPEAPGTVVSPYGSRRRVEVSAQEWVTADALVRCPETGRPFRLPPGLPHLDAGLLPGQPGIVTSPFAPNEPFQLNPNDWRASKVIRCPSSGQPLRMPASLPDWQPIGIVKQPGQVFSPFGSRVPMPVAGKEWVPGATLKCSQSGFPFALPKELPPMPATPIPGVAGKMVSPYTGSEVQVAKSQWRRGAQITCPGTGRPFVMPEAFPVWPEKPFNWMLVVVPIVLLCLAGGGAWYAFGPKPPPPHVTPVTPDPVNAPVKTSEPDFPESIAVKGDLPADTQVTLVTDDGKKIEAHLNSSRSAINLQSNENSGVRAWWKQNASGKKVSAIFSAPGFKSQIQSVEAPVGGEAKVAGYIELPTEVVAVSWKYDPKDSAFYDTFYKTVEFESIGRKMRSNAEISAGKISLAPGDYKVTLIGQNLDVEDSVVNPKLRIAAGAAASLVLPPAVPRVVAGLVRYRGVEVNCDVYGDRTKDDVQVPKPKAFSYSKVCLIAFDPSYRGGQLIDENSVLGISGLALLDQAVRMYAVNERQKNQAWLRDSPNYANNRKALEAAEELLKPLNAPHLDVAALKARRDEFLDLTDKLWASPSAKAVHNPPEFLVAAQQWFGGLHEEIDSPSWARLVGCISGNGTAPLDKADLMAVEKKIFVRGKNLTGAFVEQPFKVTKLDETGTLHLAANLYFANLAEFSSPSSLDVKLNLKPAGAAGFTLSGAVDVGSCEGVLSAVNSGGIFESR